MKENSIEDEGIQNNQYTKLHTEIYEIKRTRVNNSNEQSPNESQTKTTKNITQQKSKTGKNSQTTAQ